MSGQRGSVSVLLAAGILVVLVLVLGITDVGRVLIARSKARTAADAAALAAADELALPTGADPAALAAEYATRNGADLTACTCAAGTFEAVVMVEVTTGDLLLFPGVRVVVARARAVVDLPSG
ncbi:MAG TPA: Rv3654c family TadE-like protein [Actinomycetota bacterium]|nr:Rv3654c family TadE-like protein [Actinomycetota bacterium]